MPSLTDLSSLKLALGIPPGDTTRDTSLQAVLDRATALIENYCRRRFDLHSITEFLKGYDSALIQTTFTPVRSITSLFLDPGAQYGRTSSFGPDTLLVPGEDYVLIPDQPDGTSLRGQIQRIDRVWPAAWKNVVGLLSDQRVPSMGNIKITYSCGWNPIPSDLADVCLRLAMKLDELNRNNGRPVVAESYEDRSKTYPSVSIGSSSAGGRGDGFLMSPDITAILERYRRLL